MFSQHKQARNVWAGDVHLSQVVVGGGDESTRGLAEVNGVALGRWRGKLIRHKDLIHLAPRFRPHLYL